MLFLKIAMRTCFTSGTKLHRRVGSKKVYHHYALELQVYYYISSLLTQIILCGLENLYISANFVKVTLNESGKRVVIDGVCHPSRGILKYIVQDAVTKKDDILKSNNTVKSARLIGDSKYEDLVAISQYDSNSVLYI